LRHKPKNIPVWLLVGWLICGVVDLFLPHPKAYVCVPVSIGISIAISAAITAGTVGLQYLIAKRQKAAPTDRGKSDDIRISIPGYGEQIVKSWGKGRGAPVWFWYTKIVDRPIVTPGHSGGKGPPKPPTGTDTNHQYYTSMAGVFHDGAIQSVRRIWFNGDLVWNIVSLSATRYEAEKATLGGSATIVAATYASNNGGVSRLGNGPGNNGYVDFSVAVTDSGLYDLALFYQLDSTTQSFEVWLDGVSQGSVSCAASGPGVIAIQTMEFAMTVGTRVIRVGNSSANAPNLDCIEVAETLSFSGGSLADARVFSSLTDPAIVPPTNQVKPWATYNAKPLLDDTCPAGYHLNTTTGQCDPDVGGTPGSGGAGKAVGLTANLAKWGSPQIRVYLGTNAQTADPAIVADKGAANTPAWRGLAYLVIDSILLSSGALPNVTIEWDQGTTAVDQIVTDHYALGGVSSTYLDVSALAGLTQTGVIRTSQKPIGDSLRDLQTKFQFDMIEVDGVVRAALRNRTAIDFTIPFSKLRAHADGSETPPQDCIITDIDPLLLPWEVQVNYVDQTQDYHNGTQSDNRASGPQTQPVSTSLSLVDFPNNMKRLASTLLYKPDMEGRALQFETGPEFFNVIPGSIGQLILPNTTHTVRVGDGKYGLPTGICQFQSVRQAASIYSPTGFGSISGAEAPIAGFPSNTKGIIIDGPILRPEDAGDGTQVVVYVAMCGIGGGVWPGGFWYQESPIGSGNYAVITICSVPSGIGVTAGTLASVTDNGSWDRTSALTINLYYDPGLASRSEAELLMNPEANLAAVINPSTSEVEYVQFASVTPNVAASPFVASYTISTLLRGRIQTENNMGVHTSADDVVIIDSTIKPRRFESHDIGR
jgi:hypothetical protein